MYCDPLPFEELPRDYTCPQCAAPPRRFAKYDPETGLTDSSANDFAQLGTNLTVVVGLIAVAVLAYVGLTL